MKISNTGRKDFRFYFLLVCLLLTAVSFSQNIWTTTPFELKVFIENKGQFDKSFNNNKGMISYACSNEAVGIFFTTQGLTYKYNEVVPLTREEKEGREKRERKEKEKHKYKEEITEKYIPHYVHMNWQGANPDVQIISEEAVPYYYAYADAKDRSGKTSLKASAYKKIIYKNLYPNIDVEYTFPENKAGIKYSFILHPGADASVIKMYYYGEQKSFLDNEGNIQLSTPFGNITDHAPITYYQHDNNLRIGSFFSLDDNTVTFNLEKYDLSQTVIIDPWTTNPTFNGYNAGYDIDYDYAGNVYVYGGAPPPFSSSPAYQEIKLNSSGAIQWVYASTSFAVAGYYGDFAVDPVSGSSYITQPYAAGGNGTKVAKVNAAGNQIAMFPGDPKMQEMWRIAYNNCTKKLIIAGSSFTYATDYQACVIDTNVTAITPVDVLNGTSYSGDMDMALLALDNSNNAFMANCGNKILKCPAGTLTPTAYILPNNHSFMELNSVAYIGNTSPRTCGYNGMAVSNKYLYTYDGMLIQRWNKNTGAFMNGATISNTPFRWGGITVDDCDNIFVGHQASVIQYDTSFTVVATIPMAANTDTVYDVKIAPGNLLYACGRGFVSSFQLNLTCTSTLNLAISATGACSGLGAATANVTGGAGPYTYLWNPTTQTTQTATGLAAGNYTVTVTDNSCISKTQTATVTITSGANTMTTTVSQNNLLCNGAGNGNATITPAGGTAPYSYQWSASGQTTSTASGLMAGTYTATVTDVNGCTKTETITISEPTAITATTSSTPASCTINDGSATVNASGGTGSLTYNWLPSGGNNFTASGLAAGNYTATVSDANGCTKTQTVSVTSVNTLSVNISSIPSNCTGNNGSATATTNGGIGPYTYNWNNGQTTQTASGLAAANYTATITDANGCTKTQTITVTSNGGFTLNASFTQTGCTASNGTATANPIGGTTPYTYNWSNGQITQTAIGLAAGNYSVTVTDASGCWQTQVVNVTQTPGPAAFATAMPTNIALGASTTLTAAGGGTYQWTPSADLSCDTCVNPVATPAQTTNYCVVVTDANGCTASDCITINVDLPCGALFIPNAFSPNSDNENDMECVIGNCIETLYFAIYNRWGEKIFETTDPKICWDGMYNGKPLNAAVFIYTLEATLKSGEQVIKKGNISLIR